MGIAEDGVDRILRGGDRHVDEAGDAATLARGRTRRLDERWEDEPDQIDERWVDSGRVVGTGPRSVAGPASRPRAVAVRRVSIGSVATHGHG